MAAHPQFFVVLLLLLCLGLSVSLAAEQYPNHNHQYHRLRRYEAIKVDDGIREKLRRQLISASQLQADIDDGTPESRAAAPPLPPDVRGVVGVLGVCLDFVSLTSLFFGSINQSINRSTQSPQAKGPGTAGPDDMAQVGNGNALLGNTLTTEDPYAAAGLSLGKVPF
jgi:hypothetical protein